MKVKNHIDPALAEFTGDAVTVRVLNAIFGAVPFAPQMPKYYTLAECAQVLYPQATPKHVDIVYHLAQSENVGSAIWMANAIDTGDTGIAVYSGVTSALTMFFGKGTVALDTDSEQGVDTVLKLLGVSYIVWKLFPGGPQDKASAFYQTPAGQALAFYFASIDVALPFADNMVSAGGNALQTLFGRFGGSAVKKISALPGGAQVAREAQGMVGSLIAPLQSAVNQVAPYTRNIATAAQKYLPGVMSTADKVAGVVAGAADVLPVYRFLGARLAAESCVLQASRTH